MKIKVMYFAAMREQSGKTQEIIETNASTARELYNELNQKYHFYLDESHLKVALNDQYSDFTTPIQEMDTLVFIPPVAGG